MEHDGGKSVGRCKKGKIDFRCRSYTSTDFLNYGVVFRWPVRNISLTIEKKNKQSNKQTDKQQVTEIECSKLFISLIISKSQFYIRDEGPRLVTCLPHRSFFLN